MSEQMRETIKQEIASNPIILYIKGEKMMPVCGYSAKVVEVFKQLGAPFETRNVLESQDRMMSIKEYSDWPTTPQVFINGEFIGGCDITLELFQSGELAKKIEGLKA